MLVVADTSPIIALVQIGLSDLLHSLFEQVAIPTAVETELRSPQRSAVVAAWIAKPPPWLIVTAPADSSVIPGLHAGECAAIHLAQELRADLLVDERAAYREAVSRRIAVIGTVAVLERAAKRNLIDLADAFRRLKESDFWISHRLLAHRLALFRKSKPGDGP